MISKVPSGPNILRFWDAIFTERDSYLLLMLPFNPRWSGNCLRAPISSLESSELQILPNDWEAASIFCTSLDQMGPSVSLKFCCMLLQTKPAAEGRCLEGMATSGITSRLGPSWHYLVCDGIKDSFLSGVALGFPSPWKGNIKLVRGRYNLIGLGILNLKPWCQKARIHNSNFPSFQLISHFWALALP